LSRALSTVRRFARRAMPASLRSAAGIAAPVRIAWAMADRSDTRHEIRDDGISRSDLLDCDAQSS
jgi:hypothetical protein